MPKKVTWKKGMRLTAETFEAMEAANSEHIRLSNLIATGGRFGLFFDGKPFEISVNIINNILEVVSLSCRGITKSGKIVDLDFDSGYSNSYETRIKLPDDSGDDSFILAVRVPQDTWGETDEKYSEPNYSFEILGENSTIDNDTLPIGNLVNQYGWRLNELDYVPPCLYVPAHHKYIDLYQRLKKELKVLSERCEASPDCIAVRLLQSVWTASAEGYSRLEKELWGLTPEQLYGIVQSVVRSFVIGCALDENISLEDPEPFEMYARRSYDLRNLCRDIEKGVELCSEINIKMAKVCEMKSIPEPQPVPPAPTVTKPKPVQPPQPAPSRNRWDGIEI